MTRLIIIFTFYSSLCFGQTSFPDSIFVTEIGKNVKIDTFQIINDDTVNIMISINSNNFSTRYGKWIFFFDNDSIKSKGVFSIVRAPVCGTQPLNNNKPYYDEIRVGKWDYYSEDGTKRIDLYGSERPIDGYYRHFDNNDKIDLEGHFDDKGKLINGYKYSYSYNSVEGEVTFIYYIFDGQIVGTVKK